MGAICLREPRIYSLPGGYTRAPRRTVLSEHKERDKILNWIAAGVNVLEFTRPYKGVFRQKTHDSRLPLRAFFPNHALCGDEFGTDATEGHIRTGAERVWGKIGSVEPPWVVLPLTVKQSKLRLCLDVRYVNLWMRGTRFRWINWWKCPDMSVVMVPSSQSSTTNRDTTMLC